MILLDTDHVSVLDRGGSASAKLRASLAAHQPTDVATTIVTYEEQMRGWLAVLAGSRTIQQQIDAYARLAEHLEQYRRIRVLPFSPDAAVEFQRISKLKLRIGTMDLKIAAIARTHDATLLSRNLRDFRKVPGLKVEDWT